MGFCFPSQEKQKECLGETREAADVVLLPYKKQERKVLFFHLP